MRGSERGVESVPLRCKWNNDIIYAAEEYNGLADSFEIKRSLQKNRRKKWSHLVVPVPHSGWTRNGTEFQQTMKTLLPTVT